MTALDMRTLFLSGAVVALLMGTIVLAFGTETNTKGALRSWGWSLLALTMGLALLGLQQSLNEAMAVVTGNTLIITAGVLLLRTAKRMRGRPEPWLPFLAVPLVTTASLSGTLVWQGYWIRSALTTGLVAALLFKAAYVVGYKPPAGTGRAHRIAAFTIAAYAALLAARSVVTLTRGEVRSVLDPTALDVLMLLGFQAFTVSATLGLMWIEIQGLEGELKRLATHDSLTGLLNRRAFLEHFEREVSRCRRSGEPFALAIFDLDHFKQLNDTHGHAFGDEVLHRTAQRLLAGVRAHDVLGRYGGEEFALLMPGLDIEEGRVAAERARGGVESLTLENGTLRLTTSVGVAAFPENGADWGTLLTAADRALYKAKAGGRNRVVAAETAAEAHKGYS